MTQTHRKAIRLVKLITVFQSRRVYSVADLAIMLSVHRNTVRRYLADLQGEELRFPLCSDECGRWWMM